MASGVRRDVVIALAIRTTSGWRGFGKQVDSRPMPPTRIVGAGTIATGTVPAPVAHHPATEVARMDLVVWLPAMFLTGLVTMLLCYAFIGACERI